MGEYTPFDQMPVVVTIRDINGKRAEIHYKSPAACYEALVDEAATATAEDEIQLVRMGGQIIWNSLRDGALTTEDLAGFFA